MPTIKENTLIQTTKQQYMEVPPRYTREIEGNILCKLRQSLYGLK